MSDNDLRKLRVVIKEEVTTVVKKEISASEKRLLGEIGNSEKRVLGEMGKLDYFSARTMENSHRLDNIESLPTVAHEFNQG